MPKPKLLILGGGFAGATLALRSDDFDTTLVDKKDFFEVTFAAVRGVVDDKVAAEMSFEYKDIPKLPKFIKASVVEMTDKKAVLDNGQELFFDYAVIATGSSYSDGFAKSTATVRTDRLAELKARKAQIQAAKSIVVVGGGPVGVETIAEIAEAYAGKSLTLVHSHSSLLNAKPAKMGALAQKWMEAHKVKVLLGQSIKQQQQAPEPGAAAGPVTLTTSGGQQLQADLVLWCIGGRANSSFLTGGPLASAVDAKGLIKVTPALQVQGYPHIFALGDVNDVAENKMGYLAGEQAKLTADNLKALAKGGSPTLKAWKPFNGFEMMILSLGRADGACAAKDNVCGGCLPTNIKSKTLFVGQARSGFGVK